MLWSRIDGVVHTQRPMRADRAESVDRIKGAAIREFLVWIRVRLGDERVRATFARVDDAYRATFDPSADAFGVLASTWYPAPAVHALCDALTDGFTLEQQTALAREGSRVLMDRTMRGLYRFLFEQLVSPARFAAIAPRIWRTYFTSGERSTEILSPTRHDCVLKDWRGHHRFVCLVQVHATTWIYEVTGCRNVATVQSACVADGARECRWTVTWAR